MIFIQYKSGPRTGQRDICRRDVDPVNFLLDLDAQSIDWQIDISKIQSHERDVAYRWQTGDRIVRLHRACETPKKNVLIKFPATEAGQADYTKLLPLIGKEAAWVCEANMEKCLIMSFHYPKQLPPSLQEPGCDQPDTEPPATCAVADLVINAMEQRKTIYLLLDWPEQDIRNFFEKIITSGVFIAFGWTRDDDKDLEFILVSKLPTQSPWQRTVKSHKKR